MKKVFVRLPSNIPLLTFSSNYCTTPFPFLRPPKKNATHESRFPRNTDYDLYIISTNNKRSINEKKKIALFLLEKMFNHKP